MTAGSTVGEDGRSRLRKATRLAVVPAGLADGLFTDMQIHRKFRIFQPHLTCEINGQKANIIGHVGLTALTVDVTSLDCAPGDIVSFDTDPVSVSAFTRREYV